jgi:hypothetical protein
MRTAPTSRPNHFFTGALVVAGVIVGAHFADAFRPPVASAQSEPVSPFNSGDQRKQIIDQLKDVNMRLGRMEAQLKSGLSVKVTEMPPMKEVK